jgi:hypothetical protein
VPPKVFATVATGLIIVICVLLLLPSADSDQLRADGPASVTLEALASRASQSDVHVPDEVPPGYYPPVPSKASGMTPEWREFADTVDRICALSFNYALVDEARTEHLARAQGWSSARAESAVVRIWGEQTGRIVKATARLGKPPAEQALYQQWRANVGLRSDLFFSASAAAGRGEGDEKSSILARIHVLKGRSDKLGQRFGLRICTSN